MPDRSDQTSSPPHRTEGPPTSETDGQAVPAASGVGSRLSASGVVALVEDGDTDTAAFRRVFGASGDVRYFASGEEALAAFCCDSPSAGDLAMLVVDMGLPGIDGPSLIAAVRALRNGSNPAIFGLSGNNDPHMIERALRAGADDYFVKPTSLAGLRELVGDLVELTNETAGKRHDHG